MTKQQKDKSVAIRIAVIKKIEKVKLYKRGRTGFDCEPSSRLGRGSPREKIA